MLIKLNNIINPRPMKKIALITLLTCSFSSYALDLGNLKSLKGLPMGGSEKNANQSKDNSETTKAGIGAVTGLLKEESVEEELEVGKSVAAQILGASKLLPNEKIQNYVNLIGRHVASQSERPELPWSFGVIDTPSVNAFASPGGYILITKGLFDLLDTEDELAAVLGHEITHVIKKHHFNVIKKQKLVEFGTKAIANGNDNELAKKISGMAGQMLARGLDKGAEYEADKDGIVLSARAGYDSSALMTIFDKLEAKNNKDSKSTSLLNATHPTPNDRRVELAKLITPEIESAAIPSKSKDRILSVKK